MFERTLLSYDDADSRRGLSTVTSFGLQILAVSALLAVPLLRPTSLPSFRQLSTPVSLGRPMSDPSAVTHLSGNNSAARPTIGIFLRLPSQLPREPLSAGDDAQPPIGDSGPYIPGATATNSGSGGILDSVGPGTRPIMPIAPLAVTGPVRISHMREGDLIRKVLPIYPPLARSARLQGDGDAAGDYQQTGND